MFIAILVAINVHKYAIYIQHLNASMDIELEEIFAFIRKQLEEGLKYLGYALKSNNYFGCNWRWLVA